MAFPNRMLCPRSCFRFGAKLIRLGFIECIPSGEPMLTGYRSVLAHPSRIHPDFVRAPFSRSRAFTKIGVRP